jgi:hypothetical protein
MSQSNPLEISNIAIRQDEHGRYCLNDLHRSSGGEDKHRPAYWIKNQQTTDLIELLESEQSIDGIPSIFTKQGVGTFAAKELVYAYAMWISAKFHIQVIRAYDSLVTKQPAIQNPEPPTQKALKHGLSLDQQDCIKAFVQSRCEALPKDKQRGGFLKCWSALKSKFGTSYKQIPPGDFNNALSLLARLDLGGEPLVTITPSELDTIIQNKLDAAKRTPEATAATEHNTSPQACIARLKANTAFAIPNQILPNIKRDLNLLEQHIKTLKTDHQVIQDLMDAGFFVAPKTLMITNFETWTNTNKFNPAWMIRSM